MTAISKRLAWGITAACVLVCWLAANSHCQPNVENVGSNSTAGSGYSSITVSSLAVSGPAACILVCVSENGDQSVDTVEFNGSEVLSAFGSPFGSMQWWYLPAPSLTSADVVVDLTGTVSSGTLFVTAFALSTCKQTAPTLSATGTCTDCTEVSASPTTTVDNTLLLTCATTSHGASTWTHGTGQTERSDMAQAAGPGDSYSTSSEVKVTQGGETLSSTATGTGSVMDMLAIGVEAAPAATAGRRMGPISFK